MSPEARPVTVMKKKWFDMNMASKEKNALPQQAD